MKPSFCLPAIVCILLLVQTSIGQELKILVNHLGYEQDAPKRAVVLGRATDSVTEFKVIDVATGKNVFSGSVARVGPVDQWKDWIFWTADFDSINIEGTYVLECTTSRGEARSFPFQIQHGLLEKNTLSNVIYYFKGQRCSGLLDKADHRVKYEDATNTADVHGGWYDATGDYGKHLGGLGFSTYFNMQPTPVADWALFKAYQSLDQRGDQNFQQYKRRLLDEAIYGADFLVRMKNPGSSFFRTVDAPGPGKRPEDRIVGKEGAGFAIKTVRTKNDYSIGARKTLAGEFPYEVGYRSGGGVAIAALAMASTYPVCGDFSNATYLQTAEDAFAFLETNNLAFNHDGQENILDDYCSLLAATELFKATKNAQYKIAADHKANSLIVRLTTNGVYTNYWRADDGVRPYFHAVDAGFPVISLLGYADIVDETTRAKVLAAVKKSFEFELSVTKEVANPFGYARQLVQTQDGLKRTTFFYPHDTETAPWWQGENARLSSMATAARLAATYFTNDPAFSQQLQTYAWNQLNWILGLNPYDSCMLQGVGRNTVFYMYFKSYEYTGAPGGICNGITAGRTNLDDIDYNIGFAVTGQDEDWRWSEQWLPHDAWYLYAVSLRY